MSRCGVGVGAVPAERWGVVVGTCNAGLLAGEEWYARRKRGEQPDPRLLLLVEPQAFSEALAGAFGLKGPVLSVDTACAASANAIGYAAELIREGQADAVLTGGADAFSDILVAGFNSLESLSPEPAAPYSIDRKGLSLGEGSGHARAHGLGGGGRARRAGARRVARLRPFRGRLPPDRAAPRGARRGARDPDGAPPGGSRPGRGRLRQQPRHGHGEERPGGDGGDEGRSRRRRVQGRGVEHEVDDRPPARRRGSGRGDRHGEGDRRPGRAADRELHRSRIPSATSTTCRTRRARCRSTSRCRTTSPSAAPTRRFSSPAGLPLGAARRTGTSTAW